MKCPPAFVYGGLWLGLDVATKAWAHDTLTSGDRIVIPGFFRLSLVHNRGIAFGLFDHAGGSGTFLQSLVLVCVAMVAFGTVSVYVLRAPAEARWTQASLGLLLGGIAGNMLDRIANGYVVDFLDFDLYFFRFPTFNVADTGITVGVILLLLISVRHPQMLTYFDAPARRDG